MKILHIAETIKGGVATVINSHIRYQQKQCGNDNVHVLIPEQQLEEIRHIDPAACHTFRHGSSRANLLMWARLAVSTWKQVWRLQPDVVNVHSSFAGLICRPVLWVMRLFKRRPKVVYTPHSIGFLIPDYQLNPLYAVLVERLLSTITDHIICVSKHEFEQCAKRKLPYHKLELVYNGVPLPNMNPVPPSPFKDPNKKNIIFVGRFDYQKGFDILTHIIRSLDDHGVHFTIIGDSVHDDVVRHEAPQIDYVGWIPREDLKPYLYHADALLMTSRWEGFAMAPLEAMSYGTCVISTSVSSLPELVLHNKTGWLYDVSAGYDAIRLIDFKSKAEYAHCGKNSRVLIEKVYNDTLMHQRTFDIYNKPNPTKAKPPKEANQNASRQRNNASR